MSFFYNFYVLYYLNFNNKILCSSLIIIYYILCNFNLQLISLCRIWHSIIRLDLNYIILFFQEIFNNFLFLIFNKLIGRKVAKWYKENLNSNILFHLSSILTASYNIYCHKQNFMCHVKTESATIYTFVFVYFWWR